MDLGESIRKQVQEAVEAALRKAPKNIASATNVSSSGHSVSVYVDDEVTIVERDGKRRVIRHDDEEEKASSAEEAPPPASDATDPSAD
ncbi:MAG: hypothetical protein M3144_12675 [Actinomycetota bacterium]|nr:hypothetical protein [Actinomycetota bacterium]